MGWARWGWGGGRPHVLIQAHAITAAICCRRVATSSRGASRLAVAEHAWVPIHLEQELIADAEGRLTSWVFALSPSLFDEKKCSPSNLSRVLPVMGRTPAPFVRGHQPSGRMTRYAVHAHAPGEKKKVTRLRMFGALLHACAWSRVMAAIRTPPSQIERNPLIVRLYGDITWLGPCIKFPR